MQNFESVPRRWPLARLTVPLMECVEHLDRVIAGCCWEVLITRKNPDESVGSLRQAAKCLTIMLAGYLADFAAETLRAALRSQGAPLTDEENIHLLGANYWVQPIYQELLHVASGHNASVQGERKRPCSGLVKVMANQKHIKTRVPDDNTACVSDWIGGFCPADSLMVWFPAHWAPQVLKELQRRESRIIVQGSHSGLSSGYLTSSGSNNKMLVPVAPSSSKSAITSRALLSSYLPRSELIGFLYQFKVSWIGCRICDNV